MRTTVSISDELLLAAKRRAREQGTSLGKVIDAALRRDLAAVEDVGPAPAVPVFLSGTGPRPGLDLSSNRALYEALDEGLDLQDLR